MAERVATYQFAFAGLGLKNLCFKQAHFKFAPGEYAALRAQTEIIACESCKAWLPKRKAEVYETYPGLTHEEDPDEIITLCQKCRKSWEPRDSFYCDGCNRECANAAMTCSYVHSDYVCTACARRDMLDGDLSHWLDPDDLYESFFIGTRETWPLTTGDTTDARQLLEHGWVRSFGTAFRLGDSDDRGTQETLKCVIDNLEDAGIPYTFSVSYDHYHYHTNKIGHILLYVKPPMLPVPCTITPHDLPDLCISAYLHIACIENVNELFAVTPDYAQAVYDEAHLWLESTNNGVDFKTLAPCWPRKTTCWQCEQPALRNTLPIASGITSAAADNIRESLEKRGGGSRAY